MMSITQSRHRALVKQIVINLPNDEDPARVMIALEDAYVAVGQGLSFGRAWSEFLDRHRDLIDAESTEVRRMLKENDREGLARYANRHNRERAKQAAARLKRS